MRFLVFSIGLTLFSSSLLAATISTSPLPEGERVVAGDLSKNEFYILAANDHSSIPTPVKSVAPAAPKEVLAQIETERNALKTLALRTPHHTFKRVEVAYHSQPKSRAKMFAFNARKELRNRYFADLVEVHEPHAKFKTYRFADRSDVNRLRLALHQVAMHKTLHHINANVAARKSVKKHLVFRKHSDHLIFAKR